MNNPQQQMKLVKKYTEKEWTQAQITFKAFQQKFKQLAEYTLNKPDDEIVLKSFKKNVYGTHTTTDDKGTVITGTTCKSAYCICGNMPELWPNEYTWSKDMSNDNPDPAEPISIQHQATSGSALIYSLIKPGQETSLEFNYANIYLLFERNDTGIVSGLGGQRKTNREEIEIRLRMVMESRNLKELDFSIGQRYSN